VRVELDGGGRLTVRNNARLVRVPTDGVTLAFHVQAKTRGGSRSWSS